MDLKTYLLFVVTTQVSCLTPGVAALFVATRSIAHGWRRSYWAVAGIAAANALYFALSATGITALIVASATLFGLLKWAGVAYLLYLGATALASRSSVMSIAPPAGAEAAARGWAIWVRGLTIELSNPKALLYFVALLPQFVDVRPDAWPVWRQMLTLGATCVVLDVLAYTFYGWLGARARRLAGSRRFVAATNRAAGAALIAAGLLTATVRA